MDVKNSFFYLNSNIFNVKIKLFNVKSKQDLNRITADCARHTDASIAHYRRLRPRNRHINNGFIVKKKSSAMGGTFIANYRRLPPTDGHFFNFDNYLYIQMNSSTTLIFKFYQIGAR